MDRSDLIARLATEFLGGEGTDHVATTEHEAAEKVAVSEDTVMFTEYILLKREKVAPATVIKTLERLGVKRGERSTKTGQPLKRGEHVSIDAKKAPGHLQDLVGPFHGNIALVKEVDGDDVVLEMMGDLVPWSKSGRKARRGVELRVDGGKMAGKTSGLYRWSYGVKTKGTGKMFEIIYLSDKNAKPPSKEQVEAVRNYVEKGVAQGEKRNKSYYTGQVNKIMTNKAGQDYFSVGAVQRGGRPSTINPSKGTVLYIGRLGGRPGGWKQEYMALISGADEGEE
jgi:hypothetical protein